MIIVVLCCIAILLGIIGYMCVDNYNDAVSVLGFVSMLSCVIVCGIVLVMIVICIIVHIPYFKKVELMKYEQRYNSISYVINNYTSNVISLTEEISEYNSDVLKGRMWQDSFWLSALEYDLYYDLPLIELSTEMDVLTEVGE